MFHVDFQETVNLIAKESAVATTAAPLLQMLQDLVPLLSAPNSRNMTDLQAKGLKIADINSEFLQQFAALNIPVVNCYES